MRALDDLDFDALRDYARDLLHQRGVAASDINRRRQELPYHPLLAQYQQGSEALRARLSRVAFALLSETANESWPVEVLHYLLTLVEELRPDAATETLKSLVNSRAWLDQPEGAKRQMFALRTLLGLGWLGDPNGWLRQHRLMDRAYPALVFRALAGHDLELAFGHLGSLMENADHAQQVLRLFPSLIERHSLVKVHDLAKGIAPGLSSEVASTLSAWFEKRGNGAIITKNAGWQPGLAHLEAAGLGTWQEVEDNDSWTVSDALSPQGADALAAVLHAPLDGPVPRPAQPQLNQ